MVYFQRWQRGLVLAVLSALAFSNSTGKMMEKSYCYCEYCGHKFPSVRQLTGGTCPRHPNGSNEGRHKLYEGSGKRSYTCKYCGKRFPGILQMVSATCPDSPKGSNKGSHAPAL